MGDVAVSATDHRLVDERRQDGSHVGRADGDISADPLDVIERERCRRTPPAGGTPPARRVEQVVRPFDARRAMFGGGFGASPAVSSVKRSSSRSRHRPAPSLRTRAAASSMASGMPSRRRQISTTDGTAAGVESKSGLGGRGPIDEQPAPRRPHRADRVGLAGVRHGADATRCTCSPSNASGSRLVARHRDVGALRKHGLRHASPTASSRCSQLSNTTSSRRAWSTSTRLSSAESPAWRCTSSAVVIASAASAGSRMAADRTPTRRRGSEPTLSSARRIASRVFATPPGPMQREQPRPPAPRPARTCRPRARRRSSRARGGPAWRGTPG